MSTYEQTVDRVWRHHDLGNAAADPTSLVRYATMAASSHNTQPWKFEVAPNHIAILPDMTRRCPEVDPDDHHLFASLGCAATNLAEAASAAGLKAHFRFDEETGRIRTDLERAPASRSERFEAIPKRQCSRSEYDGSDVSPETLRELKQAGTGSGVSVMMLTGREQKDAVAEYVAEGNAIQIGDSDWFDELLQWIRFNGKDAVAYGDGLFAKSMGSPEAPAWLGRLIMRFALTPRSQNRRDEKNIISSSGIAIFVSDADNRRHWVESGICYERFALQATVLGLRSAFVNQPVEVPGLRDELASWLGIGDRRPDLMVRFGRGPEMPRSLRRPVQEVIL